MKKLLFILLLFPGIAQAQISETHSNFASSADGTSYNSGLTLVTGRFYIVILENNCASATPNTPTLVITSNTNTQIATVACNTVGTPRTRITAYHLIAATSGVTNFNFSFSGQTQTGISGIIYEITGAVITGTDGSNAIVQSVTSNADAAANPSITMAAISNSQNAVIASFCNNVPANFGGAPESGWTEDIDVGHDAAGYYSMHRLTTTDNTPTVTASSSDWGGIAIEIKSASRRRIIID
jgi:hypothetical protein